MVGLDPTIPQGAHPFSAANLDKSDSVIYDSAEVAPAPAAAILEELDKFGPGMDEAATRALPEKHRVNSGLITKISIRPAERTRKDTLILLLTNPADEARVLAVSDEGAAGPRSVPKK